MLRGLIVLLALACCGPAWALANLVSNGSFEDVRDGALVGWSCVGDATVVQRLSSDAGIMSGRSAKLECVSFKRTTRDGYAMLVQEGPMSFEPGKWYRFSCWARQEGMTPGMATVELITDTAASAPYTTTVLFKQLALRHDWRRFERLFQVGCGPCPNARLFIYFDSTGTLWVDDVEVVEVDPPRPAPTRLIPAIGSRNLVPNGSFECGPAGWATLGLPTGWAPGITGLYGRVEPGESVGERHALRIDMGPGRTPVTTNHMWPVNRVAQHKPLAATVGWMEVTKGRDYTLSAYMRAHRADLPAELVVRFGAPLEGVSHHETGVVLTTKWQRYTLTVPAVSRYAFIAVGPDMSTMPDEQATVWIDDIQFEEGAAATPFETREPVEARVYTERFGNVFDVEDRAELVIQGANRTALPAEVRLRIEATDYFDRLAAVYEPQLTIGPGDTAMVRQRLDGLGKGFYWITATWEWGGRARRESIRLAIIETYPWDDSVFGVNTAPPSDEGCRALVKAGVVWARDWSPIWQHIEPEPGRFEFDALDAHMARVRGSGMRVLSVLPPFPSSLWSSEAPDGVEEHMPPGMVRLWGKMVYAPKDKDVFGRFVETTAGHLRDRVCAFEYLNEPLYTIHALPNTRQMDAPIPDLPHADYTVTDVVELLEVFGERVKAAAPGARTIGGLGARPDLLTREFFEAGGLTRLDVFNLHIYPGLRRPEGYIEPMRDMLRHMDASPGGRKPVWITEYSYFGTDVLPWHPYVIGPAPWSPNRLLRDEKEAADYSVRFAAIMLAHGVEKFFYHWGGAVNTEVNDDVPILESWMMDYGCAPRKLYAAQSTLANLLGPAPEYVTSLNQNENTLPLGPNGVYGYAFQCTDRAVLIAWAPTPESERQIWLLAPPQESSVKNIVGASINGPHVQLGESPVYVVHKALTAADLVRECALNVLSGKDKVN